MNNEFYNHKSISQKLFGKGVELLPSVDELFEIELANLEYELLSQGELINRSAFFKYIKDKPTLHFLLYSNNSEKMHQDRSAQTKAYFEAGEFSTGYATHGLFPYRGKFHPQLIKGLLNIMGIKTGDTIIDPMCGSGTANIEATLLGINSYAVDISPFYRFMTKTKYESLFIDKTSLDNLSKKDAELFEFFNKKSSLPKIEKIKDLEKQRIYNLSLLAYLDSMGYSMRVIKSTHKELFTKVLNRYVNTVMAFILNPHFNEIKLGEVKLLSNSDALNLEIEDNSIDGIITSPPYSFAIDYAMNDQSQLEYLGYDVKELKSKMLGLKGRNTTERLNNYFSDMDKVCGEAYRVIKKDKFFVMIIGSNTNQTGGIRLEDNIITSSQKYGFKLVKSIIKPIKGMRNTMKDEYILFFKK
ncbi:MAG: DNA methyltransferase [Ignavibacteriaceae bacterium]